MRKVAEYNGLERCDNNKADEDNNVNINSINNDPQEKNSERKYLLSIFFNNISYYVILQLYILSAGLRSGCNIISVYMVRFS